MGQLVAGRFEQGFGRAEDAILQQEVGQGPESDVAICTGGAEIDVCPEAEMGGLCQALRRVMAEEQECEALLVSDGIVAIHLLIQTPFNFILTTIERI